jgi:hypothetical protein
VYLVNDEYLVLSLLRLKADLFDERPDVINAVIGSSVEFHDIEGGVFAECPAAFALAAWLKRFRCMLAIQHFGQNAGTSRLADSTGAAKQESMRYMVCLQRFFQGLGDMLLPDDIFKPDRTVFSCGYDESHQNFSEIMKSRGVFTFFNRLYPATGYFHTE